MTQLSLCVANKRGTMINETDRRILAAACKVEWLELTDEMDTMKMVGKHRPSFTTPDDWELVRVNVIQDKIFIFSEWLLSRYPWENIWETKGTKAILAWFLTLSPEECCQLAADFIKANVNLFPEKVTEILGSSEREE